MCEWRIAKRANIEVLLYIQCNDKKGIYIDLKWIILLFHHDSWASFSLAKILSIISYGVLFILSISLKMLEIKFFKRKIKWLIIQMTYKKFLKSHII